MFCSGNYSEVWGAELIICDLLCSCGVLFCGGDECGEGGV